LIPDRASQGQHVHQNRPAPLKTMFSGVASFRVQPARMPGPQAAAELGGGAPLPGGPLPRIGDGIDARMAHQSSPAARRFPVAQSRSKSNRAALQGLSQRRCEKGTRLSTAAGKWTQSNGWGELELARRIAKGRLQPERLTTILRVGWFLDWRGVRDRNGEGRADGRAGFSRMRRALVFLCAGNSSAGGWGLRRDAANHRSSGADTSQWPPKPIQAPGCKKPVPDRVGVCALFKKERCAATISATERMCSSFSHDLDRQFRINRVPIKKAESRASDRR